MEQIERIGFGRRMAREEINLLPLFKFPGRIHLVKTPQELGPAVEELTRETVLGFDTETRPAFVKGESYPPALIQLASSQAVYIFQLNSLKFRQKLRSILAKKTIIKAGVAPDYDVRQLQDLGRFGASGFVDLSSMAKAAGIKNRGLRGMAAILMGVRVAKGARKSNWARHELTDAQIRYAATDAWISREIYLHLRELGEKLGGQ